MNPSPIVNDRHGTMMLKPPPSEHWSHQAEAYNQAFAKNVERRLYASIEAKLLREAIGDHRSVEVLDLCCGCGRNTLALAAANPQWTLVGLDAAPGMLRVARGNAAKQNISNVTFLVGDCRTLPFDDEAFDAVVGTRFMYMMSWQEKRLIIQECWRVLKPGGRVALQFNAGFWGIKEELVRLLLIKPRPIRHRYLWPFQANRLFQEFRVLRVTGIKLFWLGKISRLIGQQNALRINSLLSYPGLRWLSGYVLVVAEKTRVT